MPGDLRAIVAIVGSILVLAWPILVMLLRAAVEGRRWRNRLMARAWIGSWFSGSGLWITAVWIGAIMLIRVVTDALLAESGQSQILAWVLVVVAMAIVAPLAWRAPRERKD